MVPPVEGSVLVCPVLERLGRAELQGRRDEVQGGLLQAKLGLGIVVWIAQCLYPHVTVAVMAKADAQ